MALGERAKPRGRDGESELYLGDRQLSCVVCDSSWFTYREVLMNTSGMTFIDLDWANRAALGAVCTTCGYVHTFLDDKVELREPR